VFQGVTGKGQPPPPPARDLRPQLNEKLAIAGRRFDYADRISAAVLEVDVPDSTSVATQEVGEKKGDTFREAGNLFEISGKRAADRISPGRGTGASVGENQ
jgi:hypothetical protein